MEKALMDIPELNKLNDAFALRAMAQIRKNLRQQTSADIEDVDVCKSERGNFWIITVVYVLKEFSEPVVVEFSQAQTKCDTVAKFSNRAANRALYHLDKVRFNF